MTSINTHLENGDTIKVESKLGGDKLLLIRLGGNIVIGMIAYLAYEGTLQTKIIKNAEEVQEHINFVTNLKGFEEEDILKSVTFLEDMRTEALEYSLQG
jgi:hypothetical protein